MRQDWDSVDFWAIEWAGNRQEVTVRQLHKNVVAGVINIRGRIFYLISQFTSYAAASQKYAVLCSVMHRIQTQTNRQLDVFRSVLEA